MLQEVFTANWWQGSTHTWLLARISPPHSRQDKTLWSLDNSLARWNKKKKACQAEAAHMAGDYSRFEFFSPDGRTFAPPASPRFPCRPLFHESLSLLHPPLLACFWHWLWALLALPPAIMNERGAMTHRSWLPTQKREKSKWPRALWRIRGKSWTWGVKAKKE